MIEVLVLTSALFRLKTVLLFDWLLHVSVARPRIWACDTTPLLAT